MHMCGPLWADKEDSTLSFAKSWWKVKNFKKLWRTFVDAAREKKAVTIYLVVMKLDNAKRNVLFFIQGSSCNKKCRNFNCSKITLSSPSAKRTLLFHVVYYHLHAFYNEVAIYYRIVGQSSISLNWKNVHHPLSSYVVIDGVVKLWENFLISILM